MHFYEVIYIYEVQERAKLTYGDGNQNNDCLWGIAWMGIRDNFMDDGNVLWHVVYMGMSICQNSLI